MINKTNAKFNIYYLNFSKVYETKMLLNHHVTERITKERRISQQSSANIGIPKDLLTLNYSENKGEFSKLTETIKVKEEKSVVLNEIINICKIPTSISELNEGDLIKIDNIKIKFYSDEGTQLIMSLLNKDVFEGIQYEGYAVNNFISACLNDISYLLKCEFDENELIFKIPMENSSEFESKYSINDLLIGKLSIIGVYKGEISEDEFKQSLISRIETENESENLSKIKSSSKEKIASTQRDINSEDKKLPYIDIFAIIQNINYTEQTEETKKSIWNQFKEKIINITSNGG